MDLLGDVLRSLNVFSHSLGTFSLAGSWSLLMPAFPPGFTYVFSVTQGTFWLNVDSATPVKLESGDFVLLTGGKSFQFASDLDLPPTDFVSAWLQQGLPHVGEVRDKPIHFEWGSGCPDTQLFTMLLTIQEPAQHPLLALLPTVIPIKRGSCDLDIWMDAAMRFCERESLDGSPGFSATALHLTELIFSSFVRAHLNTEKSLTPSWLKGLSDRRIGQALTIMHLRCDEHWTASLLADEVDMARSSFARAFRHLVGQSPMEYLVDCRIQLAARYLLEKQLSVSAISEAVGYRSERAFREAFRQRLGMVPRDYVKVHRDTLDM
jgi:AraC-like DNA-binding protein